jgi:hypothetical protein
VSVKSDTYITYSPLCRSRVIQNLKDFPPEQTRVAFHYCSKAQSGGERIDQVSVLRSIVRQMAWVPEDNSIASPMVEIYELLKCNRKEGNLSVENYVDLIKKIAESARKLHSASFRIIIDALDECEETKKLLKSLNEATKTCSNVFLMFSSRFNIRVPDYLLPAVIQMETKTATSSEDMTFFVSNEIERQDERLPGIESAWKRS